MKQKFCGTDIILIDLTQFHRGDHSSIMLMVPNIVLQHLVSQTNENMAMKVASDRLMINMHASTTVQSILIKCWSVLRYFYVGNFAQTIRRLSRNSKAHHVSIVETSLSCRYGIIFLLVGCVLQAVA